MGDGCRACFNTDGVENTDSPKRRGKGPLDFHAFARKNKNLCVELYFDLFARERNPTSKQTKLDMSLQQRKHAGKAEQQVASCEVCGTCLSLKEFARSSRLFPSPPWCSAF